MAFFAVIRRASSSAVHLAARAAGRPSHVQSFGRVMSKQTLVSGREGVLLPHVASSSFSSSAIATKPTSDVSLLKVIDAEIKCAEECDDHDRVEGIPERFPFDIQDEKGMNIITLKRTYQDEYIEVIVSMPSLVTGDEPEDTKEANHQDDEDGGDEDDAEKPTQSSIPITVNISKGDGPSLEFSCTAYPDEVVIDAMSVREIKGSDEEMIAYEGPDFNDLDENLQKAFHKYLELRGISAMTTNFLHEYMINKDSREYLFWLKNLKQFFEK
ncbi:mitochondrial glycoprotein [Iris pallida]|uniref:Mitochondrial glycoprotein n=1 Tax=Iris pallida TaxID=29817 RepID=A0AAX6E3G8_IRIPA|nr:mitochondrial glycoprotein [Iris pallida]